MTSTDDLIDRTMTRIAEDLDREGLAQYERDHPGLAADPRFGDFWAEERNEKLRRERRRIRDWARTVPAMYASADLAKLTADQKPEAIRGWLESTRRNLFLAGPVGTGKSYAARALAHEAVTAGQRVQFWSTPRLMLAMRPDNDPMAFDLACWADLLVLDDVAATRPTDWATEQLFCIADERANNMRRTVLTTNAKFADLEASWGAPTMDRFRDDADTVVLAGKSRRGDS